MGEGAVQTLDVNRTRWLFPENFPHLRIDSPHTATTADAGQGFVVLAVGVTVLLAATVRPIDRRMRSYPSYAEHGRTFRRSLATCGIVLVAVLVVVRPLQVTCVAQRGRSRALKERKSNENG